MVSKNIEYKSFLKIPDLLKVNIFFSCDISLHAHKAWIPGTHLGRGHVGVFMLKNHRIDMRLSISDPLTFWHTLLSSYCRCIFLIKKWRMTLIHISLMLMLGKSDKLLRIKIWCVVFCWTFHVDLCTGSSSERSLNNEGMKKRKKKTRKRRLLTMVYIWYGSHASVSIMSEKTRK